VMREILTGKYGETRDPNACAVWSDVTRPRDRDGSTRQGISSVSCCAEVTQLFAMTAHVFVMWVLHIAALD
jgi:hypothetical protein